MGDARTYAHTHTHKRCHTLSVGELVADRAGELDGELVGELVGEPFRRRRRRDGAGAGSTRESRDARRLSCSTTGNCRRRDGVNSSENWCTGRRTSRYALRRGGGEREGDFGVRIFSLQIVR